VLNAVLQHVLFTAGAGVPDVGDNCAGVDLAEDLSSAMATTASCGPRAASRSSRQRADLPRRHSGGGIGVSGDGIDQDDMIAFLGLHNAAAALGTINNAPPPCAPIR
jgi:hypothetical protein